MVWLGQWLGRLVSSMRDRFGRAAGWRAAGRCRRRWRVRAGDVRACPSPEQQQLRPSARHGQRSSYWYSAGAHSLGCAVLLASGSSTRYLHAAVGCCCRCAWNMQSNSPPVCTLCTCAGLGGVPLPKRDLHRFVKWPQYVRLQRQKRVLSMRLKVPPIINQVGRSVDWSAGGSSHAAHSRILFWYLMDAPGERIMRIACA